jgi:hypothetical protein
MTGLVLRLIALKVQALTLNARRNEIREELLRRLEPKSPEQVAGKIIQKVWSSGSRYWVERAPSWRLEIRSKRSGTRYVA